jgi:alkaline phosphatase D
VTAGETTATETVLWLRGRRPGRVVIRHGPELPGARWERLEVTVGPATDLTAQVRLRGLRPGRRHRYEVSQDGETVQGGLRAAPPPDDPAPLRLAWSGDLGGRDRCRRVPDGYPIFRAIRAADPDVFLFVGDTIYADHRCPGPGVVPGYDFRARSLSQFRAKHRYNRADPAVQALFRHSSVLAIWDDHEVRNDFSGPDEPLMPLGRRAFLEYFPLRPPPEEPGRLYRRVRWGRLAELFILDTRQYRSPNAEPDGPGKTMLGAAQRRWLVEAVAGSPATWKLVVSTVSLSVPTGRPARDSWSNASVFGLPEEGTGFAVERDAVLRALRERGVRNLVFLVADVHHAELIRHRPEPGWTFHELIAGPLSASPGRPRALDQALNPRSLFALGGVDNFGLIAIDAGGLTVQIVDAEGRVRVTHAIAAE